jgi:GNAT superfamily N-acetyltransferase
MNLRLKRVYIDAAPLVQKILEAAPRYTMSVEGVESIPTDGIDSLTALPGCSLEQKHFMIVYQGTETVGVVDLIFGYPDPETAFLGLLLLRESQQGMGLGKETYGLVEQMAVENGFKKIRLAVVDSNLVQKFWEKLGFKETGTVRPHEGRKIKSTKRALEKVL